MEPRIRARLWAVALFVLMGVVSSGTAMKSEGTPTKPAPPGWGGLAALNCPLGGGTTTLSEGVPLTSSLPALSGSACDFVFAPAAGSDIGRIVLSGLSGDFDLYVKRGSMPTTTSWECRPYSGGNATETCELMANGLDLYAMVRQFSGSGSFTLTATSVVLPEVPNGGAVTGTVVTGATQLWKVVVPAGSSRVGIAIAGEPGAFVCAVTAACAPSIFTDADLYVRREDVPTASLWDCRSSAYGNDDSCTFDTALFTAVGDPAGDPLDLEPYPGSGRYVVGVRGYDGPADYVLTARHG